MTDAFEKAAEGGELCTDHCNMPPSILDKAATFFGNDDVSLSAHGLDDKDLFARVLNLLSPGKCDIDQPAMVAGGNRRLLRQILGGFPRHLGESVQLPSVLPSLSRAADSLHAV